MVVLGNDADPAVVDAQIRQELTLAGVNTETVPRNTHDVKYSVVGRAGNWTLRRFGLYWSARAPEGQGLSERTAKRLNAEHFGKIRVNGRSGGDEVERHLSDARTIDCYHIDNASALDIFTDAVRRG